MPFFCLGNRLKGVFSSLLYGMSVAVFPKAWREGAKSGEKDGEGSALKPDISEKPCVAWTRSCWTPHPTEIISLVFKLKRKFQADRLSAA